MPLLPPQLRDGGATALTAYGCRASTRANVACSSEPALVPGRFPLAALLGTCLDLARVLGMGVGLDAVEPLSMPTRRPAAAPSRTTPDSFVTTHAVRDIDAVQQRSEKSFMLPKCTLRGMGRWKA
jgi:hypothetical protein